jgi:hypothetical protein
MRGTDVTTEQVEHARAFWLARSLNPAAIVNGVVYASMDDIARMMAWYGALRFEAGRTGEGGTLERPGELVVR